MPFVDYEREGAVAVVTMNRQERLNAFGSGIAAGLKEAFTRFQADEEARAAVLRGAGRAFCAGVDVKEIAEAGKMFLEDPLAALHPFGTPALTKPVIAAIQGHCLGAGLNLLAMQCDIRIAADDAVFGLPELERGIYCLTTMFHHQLPRNIILELSLLGTTMDARRAYELGMVNRVVPLAELMATAMEMARKLASLSPLALRLSRHTVVQMTRPPHTSLLEEPQLFRRSASSRDMVEGMKSWTEKRPPIWKGE